MKRFTETDKWRDSWFRKLRPMSKLAFYYVVENCDAAGVWDPDFDLADFAIGEKLNWIEVLTDFGDRVKTLQNGKWHLTKFIEFQYGELIEILKGHGIPYRKGIRRVSIPPRIGQEEDKDKTGQEEGASNPAVTAEMVYDAYPRKEARQDALRAIAKALTQCEATRLLAQTKAFSTAVAHWPAEERRFVPYPATWFNGARYEDDPATWNRGAACAPNGESRVLLEPSNFREVS
jgi:hypothetical protein